MNNLGEIGMAWTRARTRTRSSNVQFHDTVLVALDILDELTGSLGNGQLESDPANEFMLVRGWQISSPQPTSQGLLDIVFSV